MITVVCLVVHVVISYVGRPMSGVGHCRHLLFLHREDWFLKLMSSNQNSCYPIESIVGCWGCNISQIGLLSYVILSRPYFESYCTLFICILVIITCYILLVVFGGYSHHINRVELIHKMVETNILYKTELTDWKSTLYLVYYHISSLYFWSLPLI